tara:strand:- start:606 stop:2300 length:1695 start_codon:yes stop_codon:yes gene_type:complete
MKILGISTGHDSGAAIVIDGILVAAINEERLTRNKLHVGFPAKSIDKVLEVSNLKLSDLEYIAIEGKKIDPQNFGQEFLFENKSKKFLGYLKLDRLFLGTEVGIKFVRFVFNFVNYFRKKKIKEYFYKKGFKGKFELIEHHLAHAASAYYTQIEDSGLSITLDGGGEGYCSHVYISKNNKLDLVHKITSYHSLPIYYGYITQILGFIPLRHEGKVLGLSASGNHEKVEKKLRRFIYFDEEKLKFINTGGYYKIALSKLKKELKNFSREDIAAGIQSLSEKLTINFINALINKFSKDSKTNIFLAGGIFANIKINQKIADLHNVNSCYIFPNMGDGGLGAGCALELSYRKKPSLLKQKITMSLGSKYDSKNIKNLKMKHSIVECKSLFEFVAEQLEKNKIIGIFEGKMEYGPRALGNRSIICSAKNISINEQLNMKLKRSDFMPFAPCVLANDFYDLFETNLKPENFEYMTFTCKTKKICKDIVPAIVHIDQTARPQAVFENSNNFLYKILKEYKKISGVGLLINTSFNVHEEPIVETLKDAIKSSEMSKLDFLVFENIVIKIEN